MLTTAIDVFEPEIRLQKSYTNLSRSNTLPALPGDIIEFTVTASNKGSDPADSLIVTDSLYGGGIYVPGSLVITNGANAGGKTDVLGDDQLEFDAVNNVVKARLGIGANGTKGGKLLNVGATDSISTFKFQVQVSADCEIFKCKDSLYNMAFASYYGQTSLGYRSLYSAEPGVDAFGCPKVGPVAIKIDVNPICPPYADTAITNCTPYVLANILPFRPGFNTFFNSGGTPVTEATATGTYYAVRTIYPGFTWLPACKDSIVINFTATVPCVPLPVSLLKFEAQLNNKAVNLNWATAQETNSSHFELERSTNGLRYEKLATVAAAGNSSTLQTYQYIDRTLPATADYLYYRLVLADKDGKQNYSPVRLVTTGNRKAGDMALTGMAPNPAHDKVVLQVALAGRSAITLQIVDAVGRIVLTKTANLQDGQNQVQLNTTGLPHGSYVLRLTNPVTGLAMVRKLSVQ